MLNITGCSISMGVEYMIESMLEDVIGNFYPTKQSTMTCTMEACRIAHQNISDSVMIHARLAGSSISKTCSIDILLPGPHRDSVHPIIVPIVGPLLGNVIFKST